MGKKRDPTGFGGKQLIPLYITHRGWRKELWKREKENQSSREVWKEKGWTWGGDERKEHQGKQKKAEIGTQHGKRRGLTGRVNSRRGKATQLTKGFGVHGTGGKGGGKNWGGGEKTWASREYVRGSRGGGKKQGRGVRLYLLPMKRKKNSDRDVTNAGGGGGKAREESSQ